MQAGAGTGSVFWKARVRSPDGTNQQCCPYAKTRRDRMRRLFAATVLAAAVIGIPANVVATPPQAKTFVAHLTGAQETPPNASAAQGEAIFHLNPDGTLSYKLIVANIEG